MQNKIFRILCISILAFLLLEGVLRLTGLLFFSPIEADYDYRRDKNKIRILAVGESTTDARNVHPGKAWPAQLEDLLNSKGYNVKVYNKGKSAINSALILSILPGHLDLYRPHFVISMMGINDSGSMRYDHSRTSLRTLKLLSLVRNRISSKFSCRLETFAHQEIPAIGEALKKWSFYTIENLDLMEKEMRLLSIKNSDVASMMGLTSYSIKVRGVPANSMLKAIHERAFAISPLNEKNIVQYLSFLHNTNNQDCLKIVDKILPCMTNLTDEVVSLIGTCYRQNGVTRRFSDIEARGISIVSGNKSDLSHHYQTMKNLVREQNAVFVATQYPTLQIDGLKSHFSSTEDKDVIFVSNEENFQQALKKYKFEELFTDKFRGSWGHLTPFGHSLIAGEVFAQIEPEIRKLSRK